LAGLVLVGAVNLTLPSTDIMTRSSTIRGCLICQSGDEPGGCRPAPCRFRSPARFHTAAVISPCSHHSRFFWFLDAFLCAAVDRAELGTDTLSTMHARTRISIRRRADHSDPAVHKGVAYLRTNLFQGPIVCRRREIPWRIGTSSPATAATGMLSPLAASWRAALVGTHSTCRDLQAGT